MATRNVEVVDSFLRGEALRANLSTDGRRLRSYGVVIAEWSENGREVVMPHRSVFHSVTTSHHRSLVRETALRRGIVVVEMG